jgi:hypothetical protein
MTMPAAPRLVGAPPAASPPPVSRPLACERCGSSQLQWLTPPDRTHHGAMLFCDACSHLTIVTRRTMLAAVRPLLAA